MLSRCYWHCSDETVHYKSDKTVNLCGFRCATTSPITVFINVVFYIYICIEVAYGRGTPVDSYKTIVSTDDDDGQ